MAQDEPQLSVGGLLSLVNDRQNLVRILLEKIKSSFARRKKL